MERSITIRLGQNDLAAALHYPDENKSGSEERKFPAVVVCHGFMGDRIGPNRLFVRLARTLTERGFAVLRFDYAGCGESTGDYGSQELRSFVHQTRLMLDYILDFDFVDPSKVTLIGHGLGSAIAMLTAAEDHRVSSLVLWAPSGHPAQEISNSIGKDHYEELITKGQTSVNGFALQQPFFSSLSAVQLYQEARRFSGDVLLVHGTADEVSPVDNSFLYQKVFWTRSTGSCDKEIVMQADHVFSGKGVSEAVIRKTAEWLENLGKTKQEWYGWMI